MKKIFEILEGWFKYILSVFKFYINSTAKKREEICKDCEFCSHNICKKCGCFIKAKTKVNYFLDENGISIGGCPVKKW